jgi:hypothetical protein
MTDPEGGTGDIPMFFLGFLALAPWVDWRTTDWHERAYGPYFRMCRKQNGKPNLEHCYYGS